MATGKPHIVQAIEILIDDKAKFIPIVWDRVPKAYRYMLQLRLKWAGYGITDTKGDTVRYERMEVEKDATV